MLLPVPERARTAGVGMRCQVSVASGRVRQERWALVVERLPADNCLAQDRWRRVLHAQSAAFLRL